MRHSLRKRYKKQKANAGSDLRYFTEISPTPNQRMKTFGSADALNPFRVELRQALRRYLRVEALVERGAMDWPTLESEQQTEMDDIILILQRIAGNAGAGENVSSEAAYCLGCIFNTGRAMKTAKPARAAELFQQAAEGGHFEALYNLGLIKLAGAEGVHKDESLAFELFHLAAESGHAKSQFNTAVMLSNGEGVERDDVRAQAWFHEAASNGHTAAAKLAQRLESRRNLYFLLMYVPSF